MSEFAANLEKLSEWSSLLGKVWASSSCGGPCSKYYKSPVQTEMSRWVHVLNDCDVILEAATTSNEAGALVIDEDETLERPIIAILRFTVHPSL